MKTFLTKIVLVLGVLLVINWSVGLLLPAVYGNEVILDKYYKMQVEKDINTVFLGTSRIHCHIDPVQFDKATQGRSRSYNLGSPGSTGLETKKIIDEIIGSSDKNSIKTIYVEVPAFNVPPLKNANSTRGIYFLDIAGLYHSMKYTSGSISKSSQKFLDFIRGVRLLISNSIGINLWKTKVNTLFKSINKSQINRATKRGFSPLKGVNKDKQGLKARQQQARKFYNEQINQSSTEIGYLTKVMKEMIVKAKSHQIDLIYVMMPKNPIHQYQNKYWTLKALSPKNKLNLSSPKKYPQFYTDKLSSDKAHLNIEGAMQVTRLLSTHYNTYANKK